MPSIIAFWVNWFWKALSTMPEFLGNNWMGASFALVFAFFSERQNLANLESFKAATGPSEKLRVLGGFLIGHWKHTLKLWGGILISFWIGHALDLVYQDHRTLIAKNSELTKELGKFKNASPYETSLLNSFAYTNIVIGFSYLRHLNGNANDPFNPCLIEVTAPKENEAIKQSLSSIASAVGCSVVQPIGNPDTNPDLRAEISTGTVPDVVLIHAAKDNQRADGLMTSLENSFHARRTYDLQANSPHDLVWIQIGPGSVWRKDQ